MPRYREPFSLYPRKFKNKIIYYYRTYDEDGNRTSGISTGLTTKSAAKAYCLKLLRENKLTHSKILTFEEYAKNWWIYDKCSYIKNKLNRGGSFSRTYAYIYRHNLEKHVLPDFGKFRLDSIKSKDIEKWLFALKDKNFSNKTINHILGTLRIMLNEAYRLQYIKFNPIVSIKPLKAKAKARDILTPIEVKKLFNIDDYERIWIDFKVFTANLLSACTGMRLGEIQALQVSDIYTNYIHVCHSYERKYGIKTTKTNDIRNIPIPSIVNKCLSELKKSTKLGFIFSNDGGKNPIYYTIITSGFYLALERIGIKDQERKNRNITFHSWRHFFNTTLRSRITDSKLKVLTGHKTQSMTEHYTHFNINDFKDVKLIQEQIFV